MTASSICLSKASVVLYWSQEKGNSVDRQPNIACLFRLKERVSDKIKLSQVSYDSSIALRLETISRARSWFIFSNTGCDAKRASTLPGISY